MASIKKMPNGSYRARIFVGRDADGGQIFESITRKTEKECKSAARKREQELEEKKFINIGNMRVTTWIDEWIKLNRDRLSPSTVGLYKIYANVHYKPYFKDMRLDKLNEIHIRQFMAAKLGQKVSPKSDQKLSPNTVRKLVSVLNKILRDVLKDSNPAKDVALPKKVKYIPRVPSTEEFNAIREAVRGTFDELMVLLSGWCGLRRSEIFALKPNDIDWEQKTIRIDEGYVINDEYDYEYKAPKSDNGFRTIIVPDELMDLLNSYYRNLKKVPEKLFDMRPDHYSDRFHEIILEHEDLPRIRFHDLRHYHATWLYENDIPDLYAAQRLGDDIQTLKRIYQHLGLTKTREIDARIRQIQNNGDGKNGQNSQQNSQQT